MIQCSLLIRGTVKEKIQITKVFFPVLISGNLWLKWVMVFSLKYQSAALHTVFCKQLKQHTLACLCRAQPFPHAVPEEIGFSICKVALSTNNSPHPKRAQKEISNCAKFL